MITANALELKTKIENAPSFEPINLKCNGGFGFGGGTLNFVPNGESGEWQFSNAKTSFEPNDEFILKAIASNYQRIKEYFEGDK